MSGTTDIAGFLAGWLAEPRLPAAQQTVLERYYASYRRHFGPRMRAHYREQTRELEALLAARPDQHVLEVGCGCGTESLWLAVGGARVLGLDVRADRIETARARAEALRAEGVGRLAVEFRVQNLLDLPAEPEFDLIWMEQAFHHLEPRAEVMRQLAAILKPGGHLAIAEANGANPLLQAQLFARRGPRTVVSYTDDAGRVRQYGNERVLSAGRLAGLCARHGIARRSVRHFRLFPNRPAFERWAGLEDRLAPALPILATHYNYVGRRAG